MNNKVNNFLSAIGLIRRYKKIKNINELKFSGMLHILNKQDLRNLDLNQIYDRFSGKLANPFHGLTNKDDKTTVVGWTEDVLWPINDKMPKGFEPKKILDTSKKPQEMEQLHKSGINGSGICIAIIDERLAKHPEYADNVKYYEQIGDIGAHQTDRIFMDLWLQAIWLVMKQEVHQVPTCIILLQTVGATKKKD